MKKGKKYLEAASKVERNKLYTKEEAVKLVKETSTAKFDESVELVLRLNLDTKKADQQLRGATVLPNGIGKTKTVLVLARGRLRHLDAHQAPRAAAQIGEMLIRSGHRHDGRGRVVTRDGHHRHLAQACLLGDVIA